MRSAGVLIQNDSGLPKDVIQVRVAFSSREDMAVLKRRSHAMSERTIKGGQIQVSDIVELALGSIVILLVLLLWAYVPA